MFSRSPGKSTHQASRESGLSRNTMRIVLKKDLNFRPWKLQNVQELSTEDCDSFTHRGYNFYVFPRQFSQRSYDPQFRCSSSSLSFLISHGFDFNKLFKD
ncbi:unnamed protein product, partial [Timema podura]|nr:unnamed protein product [Timema podura]